MNKFQKAMAAGLVALTLAGCGSNKGDNTQLPSGFMNVIDGKEYDVVYRRTAPDWVEHPVALRHPTYSGDGQRCLYMAGFEDACDMSLGQKVLMSPEFWRSFERYQQLGAEISYGVEGSTLPQEITR